jgi:hypothetical protein
MIIQLIVLMKGIWLTNIDNNDHTINNFYINDQIHDKFLLLCINFQISHCKSKLEMSFSNTNNFCTLFFFSVDFYKIWVK